MGTEVAEELVRRMTKSVGREAALLFSKAALTGLAQHVEHVEGGPELRRTLQQAYRAAIAPGRRG